MPDEKVLHHGVDPARLSEVLATTEPRRRKAMLASFCLLLVAASLWVKISPGFASPMGFLLALVLLGLFLWPLFDRYWRRIAIGIVAPLLGEKWGQQSFASGGGVLDIGGWLADIASGPGRDTFQWRADGVYRGLSYSISERAIGRRTAGDTTPKRTHVLSAGVRVPVPFQGEITITRRTGVLDGFDGFLRRIVDADLQQQAVDSAFDAVFSTRASDEARVEVLLTPAFRRAMLALAKQDGRFSGSFEDGWFYLDMRIERRSLAAARLLTPMPRLLREAGALWWDLTLPHRLIDALMGEYDGPLRQVA